MDDEKVMLTDAPADSAITAGLRKRWVQRETTARIDPAAPLVDRLLAARGLAADADSFLNPRLTQLHEPALLHGIETAAERILAAAKSGEPIVVYGDYDVDGITATAILVRTIKGLFPEAKVRAYIPHRAREGYGLNSPAITELAAEGTKLIVSVDCGITAVEPAATARALGVDLIITDHHEPPATVDDLPDALAVLHPRHPAGAYPFADLCGAGVAYKLAWKLMTASVGEKRVTPKLRALLIDLLGLAALGTVADIVPLLDENRAITRFGLGRITESPFIGIKALIEASGMAGEKIDAERVGFGLGPRLNSCGRMGHAREAVELLLTEDATRAQAIAERLCRLNEERRATEKRIADQAAEMAESAGMTNGTHRAIVLAHEDWHPGVVGIVCSRLVERFGRPTILMQRSGADGSVMCAGSGRSIDGFNLHAALVACSDHLTSFGGHDMAAGLKLDADRLDGFAEAFGEHAGAHLTADDVIPSVRYDLDADLTELTPGAVESLDALAPFGRGNPTPRLRISGGQARDVRPFGKRGDHLSLRIESTGARRQAIRVVMWRQAELAARVIAGAPIEVVGTPKLNSFNGRVTVEIDGVDVRQSG
ncbi:MAG: single-stranded-DNA-specific exonuclease RecJ [Planctomycetota bacterium]